MNVTRDQRAGQLIEAFERRTEDFEVLFASKSLPCTAAYRLFADEGLSVDVASGGELSRISLAIQLVAAKASPVATLVFDEVDSGIGGAVAQTIGRSLRALGKARQVRIGFEASF